MADPNKRAVLILDEHLIWRQGTACLISSQPDFEVCGQCGGLGLNSELVVGLQPDLVITDFKDGTGDAVGFIKAVTTQFPSAAVLVHSLSDECLYAERLIRAGARGYLMKQESGDKLLLAMREVMGGSVYLSHRMREMLLGRALSAKLTSGYPDLGSLSDREMQVFVLLGGGNRSREIAAKMNVSVKTIDAYRAHIKRKLMLRSGLELIRLAVLHAQRFRVSASGMPPVTVSERDGSPSGHWWRPVRE